MRDGDEMSERSARFVFAEEVMEDFEISKPAAYKKIQSLNKQLKEQGYVTVSGKIPREFYNKVCYWKNQKERMSSNQTE